MSNTKPARLMIIVLYRLNVGASPTLQSLERCKTELDAHDKLVVWDNSPSPQDPEDLSKMRASLPCGLQYRHTPENISLAAIYNRAIAEHPDAGLVFLLDQDSDFGAEYFHEIEEAVAAHPAISLFVPLIKHDRRIVSPGHYYAFKGKYWREEQYGVVPARNTVAIASGMCIRMTYLQGFGGFEEKLKLYGIDTNFMIRYSRDNAAFYVLRASFGHALSDFSSEERLVKQARFEDFRRASRVNAKLFPLHIQFLSHFFLWYKSLRS